MSEPQKDPTTAKALSQLLLKPWEEAYLRAGIKNSGRYNINLTSQGTFVPLECVRWFINEAVGEYRQLRTQARKKGGMTEIDNETRMLLFAINQQDGSVATAQTALAQLSHGQSYLFDEEWKPGRLLPAPQDANSPLTTCNGGALDALVSHPVLQEKKISTYHSKTPCAIGEPVARARVMDYTLLITKRALDQFMSFINYDHPCLLEQCSLSTPDHCAALITLASLFRRNISIQISGRDCLLFRKYGLNFHCHKAVRELTLEEVT
ncbi:MAG: hypothetical protein Q7K43_01730 [Candidatus Woesearchaeota archaeon]|nr:hypothetical protein [Candidatus Woesearchaeota archaeon]